MDDTTLIETLYRDRMVRIEKKQDLFSGRWWVFIDVYRVLGFDRWRIDGQLLLDAVSSPEDVDDTHEGVVLVNDKALRGLEAAMRVLELL